MLHIFSALMSGFRPTIRNVALIVVVFTYFVNLSLCS